MQKIVNKNFYNGAAWLYIKSSHCPKKIKNQEEEEATTNDEFQLYHNWTMIDEL